MVLRSPARLAGFQFLRRRFAEPQAQWKRRLPSRHYKFDGCEEKRKCTRSQPLAWNENEETTDGHGENKEHDEYRQRAPVQRLADEWLADLVEVEECVLAITGQGNDRIEHVLVCEQ